MKAIGDGWYAALVPGLEGLGARRVRWGPLRGLLLFARSVRAERVFLIRHDPGWRALLGLRALLGVRRKLVALHFIEPRPVRGWRGRMDRWATRRALLVGQALTEAEAVALARRYDVPRGRFVFVPFARRRGAGAPPEGPRTLVVSAGRAACDWETLFAAARGSDWELVVVCDRADAATVGLHMASDGRHMQPTVLVEVAKEEVRGLLERAAVSVIAMRETGAAQGHVRLADAVDAGAAVVATDVAALRGYAVDGETALLVPEGDAAALRAAVDRLLADPAERERLTAGALAAAARWTWADYLAAIEALVVSAGRDRSR